MTVVVGRSVVAWAALAALLAGCSGGGTPSTVVPGPSSADTQVRVNMLAATGRAPKASQHAARVAPGRIDPGVTGKNVIYSGSYDNSSITIFKSKGINPPIVGTITNGLSNPERLFVDRGLKLWASNLGNNTVVGYKPGATSPYITISQGVTSPTGLTVGGDGTVYVANFGNDTITEYHRGKTKPFLTIATGNASPENLAVDSSNNLYISYLGGTRGSGVLKVPPGQTSGTDLNLVIGDAGGLTVDKAGNVVIIDDAIPAVSVYPAGQTKASKTIPVTDGSPFELSMNKRETKIFISVEIGIPFYIESTSYPKGKSFIDKITQNVGDWPLAVSPDNAL